MSRLALFILTARVGAQAGWVSVRVELKFRTPLIVASTIDLIINSVQLSQ